MPTTAIAAMPEEKKSRNPFKKLMRKEASATGLVSSNHHSNSVSYKSNEPPHSVRPRASTVSRGSVDVNLAAQQRLPHASKPLQRSNTVQSSNKPLPSAATHSTNPFLKPSSTGHADVSKAFEILGTGAGIAGPRNSTHHSLRGSPSNAAQYTTPFASVSRTSSHMSPVGAAGSAHLTGLNGEKKDGLLALPIEDPNDYLPEGMAQPEQLFTDLFSIPDSSSGKNKKLGDGASAHVLVIQHKLSHKYYAFKKFLLLEREKDDHFYKRAAKEFIIAKRLSGNTHIVETYAVLKVQSLTSLARGWGFVLEYCKGGDLFSLISRTGWKSSPLNEKLCLFKQVVHGVKFMHENGIVHRDLKPENVLLNDQGVCKLTDFGVAEYAREDPDDLNSPLKMGTTFVGSPPYVPPEVTAVKDSIPEYDPFAPDMWACGMILFCLVYQGTPFQKAHSSDGAYREFLQTYKRFAAEYPTFKHKDHNVGPGTEFKYAKDFGSPHVARLAWKLCDYEPTTRYTMDDLFSDPAFLNIECCVDEDNTDHHQSYWAQCASIMTPPANSVHSSAKASPIVRAKSMLDFNEPAETPSLSAPPVSSPQPPASSSSLTSSPSAPVLSSGTTSFTSPVSLPEAKESASNLPTLDEVSESVSVSTATDLVADLSVDTNNPSEIFYDAEKNQSTSTPHQTPSSESLLTFSPKASSVMAGSNPSPPRSMCDGGESPASPVANNAYPSLSPSQTFSQSMMRASSFSSVTSRTSVGSAGKRKRHHHMDVSNIQHHRSFIKKK